MDHYIREIKNKPYIYAKHYAPHDIMARELTSGNSRYEISKQLGITFETTTGTTGNLISAVPRLTIQDGISAVKQKANTL